MQSSYRSRTEDWFNSHKDSYIDVTSASTASLTHWEAHTRVLRGDGMIFGGWTTGQAYSKIGSGPFKVPDMSPSSGHGVIQPIECISTYLLGKQCRETISLTVFLARQHLTSWVTLPQYLVSTRTLSSYYPKDKTLLLGPWEVSHMEAPLLLSPTCLVCSSSDSPLSLFNPFPVCYLCSAFFQTYQPTLKNVGGGHISQSGRIEACERGQDHEDTPKLRGQTEKKFNSRIHKTQ